MDYNEWVLRLTDLLIKGEFMFSSVIAWLVGHEVVLASLVVAIIDFVMAINPAAQANSIIHWVLAQAQAIIGTVAPKSEK